MYKLTLSSSLFNTADFFVYICKCVCVCVCVCFKYQNHFQFSADADVICLMTLQDVPNERILSSEVNLNRHLVFSE